MSDPTALTIAELDRALESGALDALGVTEAYLARIEAVDRDLNCYVAVLADGAREAAAAAATRAGEGARLGPLDGVPIALKDNIDVAGVPTTNGLGPRPVAPPVRDGEVVRRLRAGGAVILGKLNMHEGAFGATTNNPFHGQTHNPWRLGFTPGGSSGGTGAAVAARLCAGGLGSDTMGSVRLPAAYCGVAGLKPTFGLVSCRGVAPLCWRLDHVGPLCRSVRDLALLLAAIAGADPESIESTTPPMPADYRVAEAPTVDGLTIGLIANFAEVETEPAVAREFAAALDRLHQLGARIRTIELPGFEPDRARRAGLLVNEAEAAVAHEAALAETPAAYSDYFRSMLAYGREVSGARLIKAERMVQQVGFALNRAFEQVDLIASPVAPQTAFAFDAPEPVNQAVFTAAANFAGSPALSVPCGLSDAGLPVGLHLMAPRFAETRLLNAAAAFEAATNFPAAPANG